MPEYTLPWGKARGVLVLLIASRERGTLYLATVAAKLQEAAGIFIFGGHTLTYHRHTAQSRSGASSTECMSTAFPSRGVKPAC